MIKKLFQKIHSGFFPRTDSKIPEVINRVMADELTFLDHKPLLELHEAVRECEKAGIEGILIEAGCAAGGSAIVMASAKSKGRSLHLHDVFGMIPEPSEKDGPDVHERYQVIRSGQAEGTETKPYYGYRPDLLEEVKASFRCYGLHPEEHKISLVPGLFADTINGTEKVALAHLDGDWYESVMVCLERIGPRLSSGGRLIIDDYDAWSGCRRAVDDYLREREGLFFIERRSRLHLIRF